MTKFAIGRWLKAADDIDPIGSTEPGWPVPQEVREALDGAYAAEYHAAQRAHYAEKELRQVVAERDQYAGVVRLLCAGAATAEPAGTPIGDQLPAGRGFEGWY